MKKVLIAYFSQGGTTLSISRRIEKGMSEKQFAVDLFNITDDVLPDLNAYDIIGLGFPVYFYRPPFNVMQFIRKLPDLKGMAFFLFSLYGTKPGTSMNTVNKVLRRKGGRNIGSGKFKGADYFIGYIKRGFLFSPDSPTEAEMESAYRFAQEIVDNWEKKLSADYAKDRSDGVIFSLESLMTKELFVKNIYSRLFKAQKDKCTSCGLCVRICPTGNIGIKDKGRPDWGNNCLFCFYCEMKCPVDAIKSPIDWPLMAPFMAYNVRQARGDSGIEKVKVIHSRGKTTRL
ncbi:EFR1 family ferrodoxin [Spirochaeta isovalerica]|uniref:Flavodoxin/ferredoxin n=1 Tax=Spirochaeta isovalerica TaxID=150 RepID=A0A841R6G4_9SPIO|nr:EFR1 family ferrodoxin [Spirochaeta isovalerica]MBB6479426.1 flavodoxin/ferredoxin [Spirochaeta isovalerica]